jgi:osmotically-inducible protein OsmY
MIRDEYLAIDVWDELYRAPKVNGDEIEVHAEDGVVTLRGSVRSPRQKYEAAKAAERVHGVVSVVNGLHVRLMDDRMRADDEIRADVQEAMLLDGLVPATVEVRVEDGRVTLQGTAAWQYERDEAVLVASNIAGAVDVIDEIELLERVPRPEAVGDVIERAWKRSAVLEAEDLHIVTSDGSVVIDGTVNSGAARDQAVQAAWAVPGVTSVDDRLRVVDEVNEATVTQSDAVRRRALLQRMERANGRMLALRAAVEEGGEAVRFPMAPHFRGVTELQVDLSARAVDMPAAGTFERRRFEHDLRSLEEEIEVSEAYLEAARAEDRADVWPGPEATRREVHAELAAVRSELPRRSGTP